MTRDHWIGPAPLGAPDQLVPTYESWTVRREAWLPAFALARRYPRDREDAGRTED